MRVSDYTFALLDAMPPELFRRLEKISEFEKKSLSEIIVNFLKQGANTPLFLGVGANTLQ